MIPRGQNSVVFAGRETVGLNVEVDQEALAEFGPVYQSVIKQCPIKLEINSARQELRTYEAAHTQQLMLTYGMTEAEAKKISHINLKDPRVDISLAKGIAGWICDKITRDRLMQQGFTQQEVADLTKLPKDKVEEAMEFARRGITPIEACRPPSIYTIKDRRRMDRLESRWDHIKRRQRVRRRRALVHQKDATAQSEGGQPASIEPVGDQDREAGVCAAGADGGSEPVQDQASE